MTNAYDESDGIIDGKIDIRHIYTKDDYLVSFGIYYSDSKRSALIMFCFPKYKYTLECGLYDEYPLMFHEYDNISIVDLSNKKIQEYRTNRSKKVIYLNNEKAVTYYKKKYIFYSVDSWEKIKSIDADEIKNYGSYTFENCEDFIFVFDDNTGKFINRISINF